MSRESINQRIKFLIEHYKLSVRAFSELISQKPANTQNYVGARGSMPGADYLQSITEHFEEINPSWLLNGKGEPFLNEDKTLLTQTNISGDSNVVASGKQGKAIQKNYNLSDCEKDRDTYKTQLDKAESEIALLRGQLARADALVAAKDEMLTLLRASYNRPN